LNLQPLCCTAEDQLIEPPDADPLVRWCGRGGAARLPPIPIDFKLHNASFAQARKARQMNLDSLRSAADLSPADRAVVDALPACYETDTTVTMAHRYFNRQPGRKSAK